MKPVNTSQSIESASTPAVGGEGALRRRAEAMVRQGQAHPVDEAERSLSEALQHTLYELRVHQTELAMQNEELRQAQLELDKQRKRYFDLYDLAPVGYCALSAQGLIREANQTAASMLGVPRSALTTKALSRFIVKSDQDVYYLFCKQLLASRQAQSCELRIVPRKGAAVWAKLTATVAAGEADDEMRIVLSDISVGKQAARALQQSEVQLDCILEATSDGILAIGEDGKVIRFNKRFEELWQIPPAVLDGGNDAALLKYVVGQLAQPEEFLATVQALYASDAERIDNIRFKDGRVFERFTAPLALESSVIGRIWSFRDITERDRLERELTDVMQEQAAILNSGIVGIAKLRDRKFVWTNAAFARMMGYTQEELVDHATRLVYSSDEASRALAEAAYPVMQQGEIYRAEVEYRCKDGSALWAHVAGSLLEVGSLDSIWSFIDITQRKQMEDQIRQMAFFDVLTALPNRRLLLDRLGQAVQIAQRSSCYGALMFLDLDNFKPLNDAHGHAAGDLLLIEVARRLNQCVRGMDTVARIGGDEFVVLLGGLPSEQTDSADQAVKLAEKIRAALAEPYSLSVHNSADPIEHSCSASIGVVLFGKDHQSLDGLLKWADVAMYRSKEDGRNRVTFMVERRQQQRTDVAKQPLDPGSSPG